MQSLYDGFLALQQLAETLLDSKRLDPQNIREKLQEQLAIEAKKFLVYRAYKVRDRQLLSLQRMRALHKMLSEDLKCP